MADYDGSGRQSRHRVDSLARDEEWGENGGVGRLWAGCVLLCSGLRGNAMVTSCGVHVVVPPLGMADLTRACGGAVFVRVAGWVSSAAGTVESPPRGCPIGATVHTGVPSPTGRDGRERYAAAGPGAAGSAV